MDRLTLTLLAKINPNDADWIKAKIESLANDILTKSSNNWPEHANNVYEEKSKIEYDCFKWSNQSQ